MISLCFFTFVSLMLLQLLCVLLGCAGLLSAAHRRLCRASSSRVLDSLVYVGVKFSIFDISECLNDCLYEHVTFLFVRVCQIK